MRQTSATYRRALTLLVVAPALGLGLGCDDDARSPAGDAPATYTFESRFEAGTSVSHGGQTARHTLITALANHIGGIDDTTYAGASAGAVVADLDFFYDFKNAGGTAAEPISLTLPGDGVVLQKTFGDLGVASLEEKMADIEPGVGWTGGVVGWGDGSIPPTALMDLWSTALETLVLARTNDAAIPTNPLGQDIALPYVNAAGIDYRQLIQKFLLGAVAYSQAADKYLDDDTDGQGLLSDNTGPVVKDGAAAPYTALEHAWDEGFGYFGAAADYGDYTDEELSAKGGRDGWANGYYDTDKDRRIDLASEYNWGASANAAKRDRGAVVATDFTKQANDAFIGGRHLITTAGGALSTDQLAALRNYRDAGLGAWELAIGATVVHYINTVLVDMSRIGTDDYTFTDHAKHFSELKGFALGLQFNPHSRLADTEFAALHAKLGDQPVLSGQTDIDAYATALVEGRDILVEAYGFDPANAGDSEGLGGW
ncbi:MAG: hypothetical protein ACI9MR_004200 [Myxococcota bacterium]|jgi:hypothetical protein